jgi:small subunit ribosomal protein S5
MPDDTETIEDSTIQSRSKDPKDNDKSANSKPTQHADSEATSVNDDSKIESKGKESDSAEETTKTDAKSKVKEGEESEKSTEDVANEGAIKVADEEKIKRDLKKPTTEGIKKYVTKSEDSADFWEPKTRLGSLVKNGEITNMKDALATRFPIREPEIIDILLPELDDEVLDVNMVQRMTDSGRRVRFSIMTVVGNGDGYVGLGSSKGKEVGPAIRKAIDNAKLNIIEIRRGCGSWECGCGTQHTLPFTVDGKSSSTKVVFRPAPRGVGLAVGDVAKHILRLSGIKDAWGFTRGETRTTINYAKAVFIALRNTAKLKTTQDQVNNLNIISGPVEITEPVESGDQIKIEKPDEAVVEHSDK